MKTLVRRHKFNAQITEVDGIKFHSKKEARYYAELKLLQHSGELLFLRQVPFYLPGNIKYLLDFMEFWADGRIEFVDTKGLDTPLSKAKRKQVEVLFPIKIVLK